MSTNSPFLALVPFERVWLSAMCCVHCFWFFALFLSSWPFRLGLLN